MSKPLISDDDVVMAVDATMEEYDWREARDFARRIESLVRKRLAERIRRFNPADRPFTLMIENMERRQSFDSGMRQAARLVESDEEG